MALSKIWVHAEIGGDKPATITLEVLTKARELADTVEAFYAGDDPQAVADYLRYGFVPAPRSIVPGIGKLPAGCVVRVTSPAAVSDPVPYWSLASVAASGLADPLALDDRELRVSHLDLLTSPPLGESHPPWVHRESVDVSRFRTGSPTIC